MAKHDHSTRNAPASRQRGASMIELLVSILIFAFGILGVVGLQNRTLGFGQVSLYRSQATALTDDILDRMRADRANAKAGNWNSALNVASTAITGTSIASTDMKDWKAQVESLLPLGKASVAFDAGTGLVTIDIQWNERGTDQTGWITKSAL